MKWYPFTPETMPPIDNHKRFLHLHGTGKADRILGVGVHCQYNDNAPYIRVVGGDKGWEVLDDNDLTDDLWAPLDITDDDVLEAKRWKQKIRRALRRKNA